jgi:hypothetical protein
MSAIGTSRHFALPINRVALSAKRTWLVVTRPDFFVRLRRIRITSISGTRGLNLVSYCADLVSAHEAAVAFDICGEDCDEAAADCRV